MHLFISKHYRLLTIFLILFLPLHQTQLFAQFINEKWGKGVLISQNSPIELEISFAVSLNEKTQGLSRLPQKKMPVNSGLLFVYNNLDYRAFWMPETYFDLDIIFLDKDLKIIAIEKNIKHFKGSTPQKDIPRTAVYKAYHVLELHAGMSEKLGLKVSDQFKWKTLPQNLHSDLMILKTK